jgi:uncharacterized Zn-finger protein
MLFATHIYTLHADKIHRARDTILIQMYHVTTSHDLISLLTENRLTPAPAASHPIVPPKRVQFNELAIPDYSAIP